jgi:DNA-directed RNA polymerase specialized sigma24 family protein
MSIDLITLHTLRAQALRLSRNAADADDAVQETLLASIQNDRYDMPWLYGVLQKQVAMQIRTKIRRRRREDSVVDDLRLSNEEDTDTSSNHHVFELIRRLPKALRQVAVLAIHGLNAEEIRYLLGIAPAAFRQRLTVIRKSLGKLSDEQSREALAMAYVREPHRSIELQLGLIRRALKAILCGNHCLGTHDLDGHLIIIRRDAHTFAPHGN